MNLINSFIVNVSNAARFVLEDTEILAPFTAASNS